MTVYLQDGGRNLLPDAHFGPPAANPLDWRDEEFEDDAPDDDAELTETPPDVVAMLGFDPLDEA
jgi:hypothetical protein